MLKTILKSYFYDKIHLIHHLILLAEMDYLQLNPTILKQNKYNIQYTILKHLQIQDNKQYKTLLANKTTGILSPFRKNTLSSTSAFHFRAFSSDVAFVISNATIAATACL